MRPIEEAFEIFCATNQVTDLSVKAGMRKVFYHGAHGMFLVYKQILSETRTGEVIERLVVNDLERFRRGD